MRFCQCTQPSRTAQLQPTRFPHAYGEAVADGLKDINPMFWDNQGFWTGAGIALAREQDYAWLRSLTSAFWDIL
jgi:hypothetical protein